MKCGLSAGLGIEVSASETGPGRAGAKARVLMMTASALGCLGKLGAEQWRWDWELGEGSDTGRSVGRNGPAVTHGQDRTREVVGGCKTGSGRSCEER